jgi:hypothetical protein
MTTGSGRCRYEFNCSTCDDSVYKFNETNATSLITSETECAIVCRDQYAIAYEFSQERISNQTECECWKPEYEPRYEELEDCCGPTDDFSIMKCRVFTDPFFSPSPPSEPPPLSPGESASSAITFTISTSTTIYTTSQVSTAVYNVLVANGYSISPEHVLVTVCNTNLFCVTVLLPNTSGRRLQTIIISELLTFIDSNTFVNEVETELGGADITVSNVISTNVIVGAPPPSPPPPSPPPPVPPSSPPYRPPPPSPPPSRGCTFSIAINFRSFAAIDDGSCQIGGCMDSTSAGYSSLATYDDGSCPVLIYGCTNSLASNYLTSANRDDQACIYETIGCTNSIATNYDASATTPGPCTHAITGCTTSTSVNYVAIAQKDDGSCIKAGCTDSTRSNYDPLASIDSGTCTPLFPGCTDSTAANYIADAGYNRDDGSCSYGGCTDGSKSNHDPRATFNDGSCVVRRLLFQTTKSLRRELSTNCLDPAASNYNSNAESHQNGACEYKIVGCTDSTANNYLVSAQEEPAGDSQCTYSIYGCTFDQALNFDSNANILHECIYAVSGCPDSLAVNYNPAANTNDGSCLHEVYGCTSHMALNFDSNANAQMTSVCIFSIVGCTDSTAYNFAVGANTPCSDCCVFRVLGCTAPTAYNYDSIANFDDGTCLVLSPPPSPPPSPRPPFSPGGGIWGDPHIHFAHGGYADFRGINNTMFAMLSAPGIQFALRTMDTDFLLPRPQLVHGSFFTEASWIVRGSTSGKLYGIIAESDSVGFRVFDIKTNVLVASKQGVWQQWWVDGIRAYSKQSTVYVRSSGWETNVTRRPIYNYVSGPSHWRFDISIRKLDDTFFSRYHGKSSPTCFPHGILGQSWDGDNVAVDGKTDSYEYKADNPVITTIAQAEGAIEGGAKEYIVKNLRDPYFKYTRFYNFMNDTCKPRNIGAFTHHREVKHASEVASTNDDE